MLVSVKALVFLRWKMNYSHECLHGHFEPDVSHALGTSEVMMMMCVTVLQGAQIRGDEIGEKEDTETTH